MKNLLEYLKENDAVKASKIIGANGAFISVEKADGSKFTLPVGKKSQEGNLADYNVLITDDGQAIATMNTYQEVESVTL
jgi:hypothetical protein